MTKSLTDIASKSLGDSTSYAVFTDKFDASLLNPMPRALARDGWGIDGSRISGFDRWNCHESTFLLNSGQPIAGTLSFVYSASSENMIESKSMKLYLNTFDMCRMGATAPTAIAAYVAQVKSDLEKCLGTPVLAHFHWTKSHSFSMGGTVEPIQPGSQSLDHLDLSGIQFEDFEGKENHVVALDMFPMKNRFMWHTNTLRSRCRHTKQKDTGTATVIYEGNYTINPVSVFKQIVSLREVNEFHEFCAEKLLFEISKKVGNFEDLSVALYYSRRGSLDINPVRWVTGTEAHMRYKAIMDVENYLNKTMGQ